MAKEKKQKKENYFWVFIVVTLLIAFISSIYLGHINDRLQGFSSYKIGQMVPTYALGIAIPSVLVCVLFGIIKSGYALCGVQGLFLACSILLLKYFSIDSTLQINGKGVGNIFYICAQAVIWLYFIGVIIYSIRKKK